MTEKTESKRIETLIYVFFILLGAALLLRTAYGFCQSDESFYISTAGRFAAGDLIFADEWHPTQMSSLITAPIYGAYVMITGGTKGIIRFFRCLYLCLTMAGALYTYTKLRKMGRRYAGIALALFMLLYCHLNMATLSYYMICFQCFLFAFIIMYKAEKKLSYVISGVFYALAVLSLPSLVVATVAVFVILTVCCVKFRELRQPFVWFLAGICIPLVLFIIYIFASGLGIAGILANLVNILSDSEHDRDYYQSFKAFFNAIADAYGRIYYLSIVLVLAGIISGLNSKVRDKTRTYIVIADLMLFIYYTVMSIGHTGFMNTAFALFVFPLFFLTDKKEWYVFLSLFMGGLAVSATYSFSSYSDLYVLSIGHGLAAAGGILLLADFTAELTGSDMGDTSDGMMAGVPKVLKWIMAAVTAVFILITAVIRFVNVYRDAPVSRLDTKITEGPAAGLYTTADHAKQYASVLDSIEKYDMEQGYVLFTRILPWGYTASGMRVGAPDTWRNEVSSERLEQYYRANPDREPDMVVVLDAVVGSYESGGDVEEDPAPNANEMEGALADKLNTGYTEHEEEFCTVYIRK